jgi:hypothetical protein
MLALLLPLLASAKISGPANVPPVVQDGIRYTAPHDNGRRGYVQAHDAKTGRLIWDTTVFRVTINPALEEDVQWRFIEKLSVQDGAVVAVGNKSTFRLDLKTGERKK